MSNKNKLETKYGLPSEVKFCKKCVVSNQRPSSTIEFKNDDKRKDVIQFDEDGVCSACRIHESKWEEIDWEQRQHQLLELLDRHRKDDGSYDVIVPGSGGKDSVYVSHILKSKYGMNPLTVTWPPNMYTDIGRHNFDAWLASGLSNITFHPNGALHRMLTREAFLNLVHPFQPFILGQKQVGPKMALKYGVKLVMYGEHQAEGGSDKKRFYSPTMPSEFFSLPRAGRAKVKLGGRTVQEILGMGFSLADLDPYLPLSIDEVEASDLEVHHMGFYEQWNNQEKFYYAVENCGFKPNPERSEGTYSKYQSLDDKIDGFHYYTTYIKFGVGRATYDAAQEIRNRHIDREEGVALVKRYDGEFPGRHFQEVLDYMNISEETFWRVINGARSEHLWKRVDGEWVLRHQVS
jgi:N-acetyl sugar amidotransferase